MSGLQMPKSVKSPIRLRVCRPQEDNSNTSLSLDQAPGKMPSNKTKQKLERLHVLPRAGYPLAVGCQRVLHVVAFHPGQVTLQIFAF